MHLVALVADAPELRYALAGYQDPQRRFYLHPIPADSLGERLAALPLLDVAGALVLEPAAQPAALAAATRRSLAAEEAGGADVLTATASGLVAEYSLGRALGACLARARYDARGARAALIGGGPAARALARELASLGVQHLALLGRSRPEAERNLPAVAASATVDARAVDDPLAAVVLREADLVVRLAPARLPDEAYGPHLTLIDLAGASPAAVSSERQRALRSGATTFDRFDVLAHQVAEGLSQVLGGPVEVDPFLSQLHTATTNG